MPIAEITLAAADLERQAAFWGETLGLPVCVGEDEVEVGLRASRIRFRRAEAGIDARYHFAINVPPGSIGRALEWIGGRHEALPFHWHHGEGDGATVVRTDVGAGCLYFLDAGGNVAELIASPQVEGDVGEFGPGSLVEIAEIGIASADPDRTSAALRDFFGAEVVWGGGPGAELTAIGDAHSVVIVAPIGRGWIPVDLSARRLPTEIVFYGAEARELTLPEGPYRLRVAPA
ncbi:MAG: hypothetical protein JSU06_08585 [Actinobacteria bacterium]|nr:hypothetical protein [Actinomycetota bacterium]